MRARHHTESPNRAGRGITFVPHRIPKRFRRLLDGLELVGGEVLLAQKLLALLAKRVAKGLEAPGHLTALLPKVVDALLEDGHQRRREELQVLVVEIVGAGILLDQPQRIATAT